MKKRKNHRRRAWAQRIALALLLAALATVIIARIETEPPEDKVSTAQTQPPHEEAVFPQESVSVVVVSDTPTLETPALVERYAAISMPDVGEVLHQGEGTAVPQFSTIGLLTTAEPTREQYDAIDAALYGPSILPDDVVFFSRAGENDRVWGTIGGHVFCYAYSWE